MEVYFEEVHGGHDQFVAGKGLLHMYYILEGEGTFQFDDGEKPVKAGQMVEIPEGVKFAFYGSMKTFILIAQSDKLVVELWQQANVVITNSAAANFTGTCFDKRANNKYVYKKYLFHSLSF